MDHCTSKQLYFVYIVLYLNVAIWQMVQTESSRCLIQTSTTLSPSLKVDMASQTTPKSQAQPLPKPTVSEYEKETAEIIANVDLQEFDNIFFECTSSTNMQNAKSISEEPTQTYSAISVPSSKSPQKMITETDSEFTRHFLKQSSIHDSPTTTSGLPSTDNLLTDRCYYYGTCEFVSKLQPKDQFCHCDDLCKLYDDCCVDANETTPMTYANSIDYSECLAYSNPRLQYGMFVVTKCVEGYENDTITRQCQSDEHFYSSLWVLGENKIVYRNRHCAECHGVSTYEPFVMSINNINTGSSFLQNSMRLSGSDLINYFIVQEEFYVEMIPPPDSDVRYCWKITEPPPEFQTNQCLRYHRNFVVRVPGAFFRNTFCFYEYEIVQCAGEFVTSKFSNPGIFDWYPLSVIFPFVSNENCLNKVDGYCIGDTLWTTYPLHYYFEVIYNFSPHEVPFKQFEVFLLHLLSGFLTFQNIKTYKVQNRSQNEYYQVIEIQAQVIIQLYPSDMLSLVDILENNFTLNFKFSSTQEGLKREVSYFSRKIIIGLDKTEIPKLDDPSYEIKVSEGNKLDYRCSHYLIDCSYINATFESGFYVNSYTCLSNTATTGIVISTIYEESKKILTYTGLGVSTFSLIISISVYRKTDMHRSIPGSNVENLSVSLLLSGIAFMVGVGANRDHTVCFIVGAIIHYLWLSVFAFKSITLVYITNNLRTMLSNTAHRTASENRTRICFTLLGLSFPLLVVAPGVLLDLENVSGFQLNYSGDICFPTGYPANLYFVTLPIGLSVVINIICLIILSGIIAKQTLETRHVRKSSSYQFVFVFARIGIATGFFWITGIISSFWSSPVTEYMFIIFCSFQGLFVTIANLSTRRMYRLLRTKSMNLTKNT